jgi:hypothetical protein
VVTITGAHFVGASAVDFGINPAAQYQVDSDTTITATSPPGKGRVDVRVTTSWGVSAATSADVFEYQTAPLAPVIDTVAGDGTSHYSGDGGPATSAGFSTTGAVVDTAGNLYIADPFSSRIRKVSPDGVISTFAGDGGDGYAGDGGPATSASLSMSYTGNPLAVDTSGNLYIADEQNHRVRRVDPDGIITTVAGTGRNGESGDGGPATAAGLSYPQGVAVDRRGNLYIAESSSVRMVDPAGTITTIAGDGTCDFYGDGGLATSAAVCDPTGVAVNDAGDVFIADVNNFRVRRVRGGIITTVAGNGIHGFSGDGGAATTAALNLPLAVAFDNTNGNLYIADTNNDAIRVVDSGGVISTFAGNGTRGFSGDGGPATSASLNRPGAVALDAAMNVYIADTFNNRIRKVTKP